MSNMVLPTMEQVRWADCELGVIIHLDLEVFTDDEYDAYWDGRTPLPPASVFAPDRLDVEQWVSSAAEMGAKYAVLVAKHGTGFCLWPTDQHGYSVKNTPYRDGKGDIVGEFFAACKKYDILPGLYYSVSSNCYMNVNNPGVVNSGDAQEQQAYNDMVLSQLTELWTRYGEVFEIWFDGGCLPVEEGGPDITSLLHRLQPNAVVFQGPKGTKSLIRWVGNERGVADEECSAIFDYEAQGFNGTTETMNKGNTLGDTWCPAESDLPNRDAQTSWLGGWMWRKGDEHAIKRGEFLFDTYLKSVGRGTNMLVGMVIDSHGCFPDADREQFRRFAQLRREAFGQAQAEGEKLDDTRYSACVPAGKPVKYAEIMEDIALGERITGYTLTGENEKGEVVFEKKGQLIGHKRILPLSGNIARVTFTVTSCKDTPAVRSFRIY